MSELKIPNDLVLYHYSFSPYARRIVWYLTLRKIPYAQCLVPATMPRNVLKDLNVAYRRIPLLSYGRDMYCDTRLIIDFLERQFPPSAAHPGISPQTAEEKAMCRLLIRYHGDSGVFPRAAELLPTNLPVLKDERWLKDRAELGMRKFSAADRDKARPENLAHLRDLFDLLENILLADGRQWVLRTEEPSLADIEAVWIAHWMGTIPGALAPSLTEKDWPRTHAYVKRFDAEMRSRMKAFGKPPTLQDDAKAADIVRSLPLHDTTKVDVVDSDPIGLKRGDFVEIYPIDSGSSHRDQGELAGLSPTEMVVRKQTAGKEIRVHVPRWGFRIRKTPGQTHL